MHSSAAQLTKSVPNLLPSLRRPIYSISHPSALCRGGRGGGSDGGCRDGGGGGGGGGLSVVVDHPLPDPHSLMKEDPIEICSNIWFRAFSSAVTSGKPPIPNLTTFLSKFDLWILAYQRSHAHHFGSFPPRSAIDSPTLHGLLSLRQAVLHGRFSWNMITDLHLHLPHHTPPSLLSKRKLKSLSESHPPVFQDRVVQEVLLMVIEPVFESRFSSKSHAFRPGRNAHTVIRTIRSNFSGYLWFLRGDVSELLHNLDPKLILNCVRKCVKDRTVLRLLKSALNSTENGIYPKENNPDMKKKKKVTKGEKKKKKKLRENEPKPDPYWLRTFFEFAPEEASKVPCYGNCGILSPLLANICLHELDTMMEKKMAEFSSQESIKEGCHNSSWPEFMPTSEREKAKKLDYLRYGGHFLVGIRAPREDAVQKRKEVIQFCDTTFGVSLHGSKLTIEHVTKGVSFLDHVIGRRVIYPTLHFTGTGGRVVSRKGVGTLLSVTACMVRCMRQFRRLNLLKGDRDPEPLPCTPMLYSGQAHTNSQMNKFLESLADWYMYADNRKKVVGFCAYVVRSSLAKLYAARYRLKSRAKVYKRASRDLSRPLKEWNWGSEPEYSDLLRMGAVEPIKGVQFSRMGLIPSCDYTPFPRNWVPEHEVVLREYIRLENPKYFCELYKSVRRVMLRVPQEEISSIVWEYKTLGIWGRSRALDRAVSNSRPPSSPSHST